MILVAGLAIAGIVGIAAAFYFSIRSGSGGKRLRSGGAGRARIDRHRGSRSAGAARSDRAAHTGRLAANSRRPAKTGRTSSAPTGNYRADESTGPNPVLDVDDPMLASADPGESAHAADGADRTARPRRRVGFRKGSDVDEELWPAESFGGVSDEQFWDDLASDKPLTTTARTAQQDPGSRTAGRRAQQNPASRMTARNTQQDPGPRNRPINALPPTAAIPAPAAAMPVAAMPVAAMPVAAMPVAAMPAAAMPAAAMPTAATPSAATPTAMPPVARLPAATQPVQSMTSQVASATQPVRAATGPGPLMSVGQPTGAAAQAAETRGRRRANRSDDEDPLTSAAFSLRSSGPVDGRSSHRSRGATREPYDIGSTQETQASSKAETGAASAGYPGGVPSFRPSESLTGARSPSSYPGNAYGDPSSVTQAMSTPPSGQNYGYGSGNSPTQAAQAAQPDDSRRPNGPRSSGRHSAISETTRSARQAYPQDGYQGSGGYPAANYPADGYTATGSYQASAYSTGGYSAGGYRTGGSADASQPGDVHRGNGHRSDGYPGNGQRAPYDPRDDYRRLTHPG
jgi:hypothetical protein